MMLSLTNRLDRSDDDILSDSEYNENDNINKNISNKWCSCCCFNRIHANNPIEYDQSQTSQDLSIASKTMDSVQDAIDGKVSLSKAKLHRYLTTPNWGPSKKFLQYVDLILILQKG